jgi:transposase
VKGLADAELERLSPIFDAMYSRIGRPSIPPERVLKACLLTALFSVRSERQLCEQLDYNLLFRWFLDMDSVEDAFDPTVFTKNKTRLLKADVARLFFEGVVGRAQELKLLSDDHFTVDGTLIEAWASLKSFRPKDEKPEDRPPPDDPGNPTVNFHGEKRSNETHESKSDPDARLARKGMSHEAKLAYSAHVLMENRNGLCVDISLAQATGFAERAEAVAMIDRQRQKGRKPKTIGADRGYDTRDFVRQLRERGVVPHVAQHKNKRRSAIDGRTVRHVGYATSQRIRKRVEEIFGWMKTVGGFRKTRHRGKERVSLTAYFVASAYNLVRIAKLAPAA